MLTKSLPHDLSSCFILSTIILSFLPVSSTTSKGIRTRPASFSRQITQFLFFALLFTRSLLLGELIPNSNFLPGRNPNIKQRVIKVVEVQKDPMEPPKFRHHKVPAPPSEPPPPVLRSPPKKLTKEDQAMWKIPPCVSNWKNAKGYVIPFSIRCSRRVSRMTSARASSCLR
mmetsp:Transcript_6279/g.6217  ORF Transcript_6279/g.6217 Transcript_6279/m.6217 type:complete len:171 (+) Transcript_6279:33-545(+)